MNFSRIFTTTIFLFFISHSYSQSGKLLIPYRVADKWGYSDTSGKIIIPITWDSVGFFYNWNFSKKDLAYVFKKGKQGIINTGGKFVIPLIYDRLQYVIVDGKIPDAIFVHNNKKQGIINLKGTVIVPVIYDTLQAFDTTYDENEKIKFLATKNKTYYQLDLAGHRKIISQEQFNRQASLSQAIMMADGPGEDESKKISVKDTLAKYGIDSISAAMFKKTGFHLVYKGKKTGLWNMKDKLILPQFDEIIDYYGPWWNDDPEIFARNDGKIGVVTAKGNILMPFKYTDYYSWDGYRVYTKQDNRMGIYTLSGKIRIDILPAYDTIEPAASSGDYPLFKVTVNNKKGYINGRNFKYYRD